MSYPIRTIRLHPSTIFHRELKRKRDGQLEFADFVAIWGTESRLWITGALVATLLGGLNRIRRTSTPSKRRCSYRYRIGLSHWSVSAFDRVMYTPSDFRINALSFNLHGLSVMAISVISISSDSSEDSVGTPAGRVILFGTIPTTIPDTTPVITPPATQTDTPVIPTETPIIAPTIPPSPDYTPASPNYSPASDSESDPSEDPSSDHIPPLPAISPFLSSDDDTTDSDTPDTPPSPTHGTPFTEITASTQRSPIIPRRRVMILSPGQPIPHGRPYRYHLNGPVHMMTARKRVGPLPTHRLAVRHSADHSSSDSSITISRDVILIVKHSRDPAKIESIKIWHLLRLQGRYVQFLGLASYYRRFIEEFSKIAKPMTKLTQKKVAFKWDDKQGAAFQTLKNKLCSAPILALPQGAKNFIVYCDASHKGLGAVLMQKEKVIAYASR
ncbi:putative reverse transcriptase domain-containing protein [Tanacetum coccineum]